MKIAGLEQLKYVLITSTGTYTLVHAPRGWEDNSVVSYKRNEEYFGVFRSWGLPMDFTYDGADILRQVYYTRSVQALVTLEIYELDRQTLEYRLAGRGDIDFSKAVDSKGVFSCIFMETGVVQNLQAYKSTVFEFPLIGEDVVEMELPGVAFNESAKGVFFPNFDNRRRFIPEMSIATESFKSGFVEVQNVGISNVNDGEFNDNPNWFVRANRNIFVRVKGSFQGVFSRIFGDKGFSVRLMMNNVEVAVLYENSTLNAGAFEFQFDQNVLMLEGSELYFYLRTNSNEGDQNIKVVSGDYEVSYKAVSDPSSCKGIRALDMFKRLMLKIKPDVTVNSALISSSWSNLVFTSGDAIREIEQAKIKMSMDSFFKTFNFLEDAGLGLDAGVFRLELASYFARTVLAQDVGSVENCQIVPAESYFFSEITIGYKDGNTDDLNGREEYNSEQSYTTPVSRVPSPREWISGARADQFGIEKIRVDYNVKKTEKGTYDIGSDNDTFMVDCYLDEGIYKPVLGASYDSVTGLSSPATAYNLRLTPKRSLYRKGAYLRSVFDKLDLYYINFASGKKNTAIRTVINGFAVSENSNIQIGSLPAPYFIPHIAKIVCKNSVNAKRLIDQNPFGYITFEWQGIVFKGYILDVSTDQIKNKKQEFELLLTPDNDLVKYAYKVRTVPSN